MGDNENEIRHFLAPLTPPAQFQNQGVVQKYRKTMKIVKEIQDIVNCQIWLTTIFSILIIAMLIILLLKSFNLF